tara:strand:+ start:2247 stop:2411 length:165 start_codon:yes stop_codon:yes gene_type:complete
MKETIANFIKKYDLPLLAFAGMAAGVFLLIFLLVAFETGQEILNTLDGGVAVGF